MTESYSVDGSPMTLAQALHQMWARIANSTRVGTTLTAYRLDGTTPAMTHTLDDGTAPTSITRAS
jgi:hypothetical protein